MRSKTLKLSTGNRYRNLTIGSLCLGSICIGLTLGWPETSLSYLVLTHHNSGCYFNMSDGLNLIQFIMNFGSCIGALVPSCMADVFGRKPAFVIAGFSNFVFWVILVTFQGCWEVFYGAAIGGFAVGVHITTTALYISEISMPDSRGTIGALAAISAYTGSLFGNCLIVFTYVRVMAFIMTLIAIMYLISIRCWLIESPHFLFLRGMTLEAKLSLKALRGATTVLDVDEEFKSLEMFFNSSRSDSRINKRSKFSPVLMKSRNGKYATAMIIALCLTQMVGAYGMSDYSSHFLDKVIPTYGKIITASLDVCSVAVCLYCIEKFGRRPLLLLISVVGTSISCLFVAILTLTDRHAETSEAESDTSFVISITIIILYYLIYSLGLTPILPILTGEILPSTDKTMSLGFCISFVYFFAMVAQFIFEVLDAKQGESLGLASFAIVGSLGIPIILMFLPETKGKSLYEIQNELNQYTILLS